MTIEHSAVLELDDIQGPVLRDRPLPYYGTYLLLRIDDPTHGREMLRLLLPRVATAASWQNPPDKVWINVALTFQGLKALGVPQASLDECCVVCKVKSGPSEFPVQRSFRWPSPSLPHTLSSWKRWRKRSSFCSAS